MKPAQWMLTTTETLVLLPSSPEPLRQLFRISYVVQRFAYVQVLTRCVLTIRLPKGIGADNVKKQDRAKAEKNNGPMDVHCYHSTCITNYDMIHFGSLIKLVPTI